MTQKKKKSTEGAPKYGQYAVRMSDDEKEALNTELKKLYDRFNGDRDSKDPKGTRAVKTGDIVKKAIWIGLETLKKQRSWNWNE